MHRKRTTMVAALAAGAMGLALLPLSAASAADDLAGGVHYASDLDWASADNGWGPVERDYNNGARAVPDPDRTIMSIRGTEYPKGLGTHADARIVYDLNQECTQALGYIGIDDSQNGRGRVDFVVRVDDEEKLRLERTGTDPAGRLNLDVRGADAIELIAEAGPEGNGNDHADWADLQFNCTGEFLAQPLELTPEDVDLSLLGPGSPVTIAIDGASPQAPVTVRFDGTEVVANADETGRAVATFVVPADTAPGEYEITASAEAKFDTTATGMIGARVVTVSDVVHHVDCSAESAGDGSLDAPFASLAQLDDAVGYFEPGEKVLFRRGAECVGTFAPEGSGLDTAPITVAPYGDGDAPATINGDGALAGIHLRNVSNWTVDGMHVTNPAESEARRTGILYEIDDGNVRRGVVLTNNHVEHVAGWTDKTVGGTNFSRSAGISVLGDGVGAFDGITVADNEVNDTGGGGIKLSAPDSTLRYNTDVYVGRNDIHEVGGDGIVIHNSDSPLIEYNSALNLGHGAYPFTDGNFAGMWPYNAKDPLFQYNVVGNSVASIYDSTAWDCDMKIKGSCTFQYNYSYGNAGGFYLDCISGCGTASTEADTILRYNVSQGDCRIAGASGGPGMHRIYNNTFVCLDRPLEDDMNAPREVKNNIFVATGGGFREEAGEYSHNAYFGGIAAPASDAHAVTADPGLVAAGSGQTTRHLPGYRLAVGSPLHGAGTPIPDAGAHDFFGEPIPDVPSIGADQGAGVETAPLAFADLVNQTAVANASNPRNGAITTDYRVFSEESLADAGAVVGETVTAFGHDIAWHPTAVGTPDALKAAGQQMAVDGRGDELVLVGFASGDVPDRTATVRYADGTSEEVEIALPQWTEADAGAGEDVELVATGGSHLQRERPYLGGAIETVAEPASVFAQRIPLSGARVASVTLPDGSATVDDGLSLFAAELVAAPLAVETNVVTYCTSGKAVLRTVVANHEDQKVAVTVDTVLGGADDKSLSPGKDRTFMYKTRSGLDAGSVVVTSTTTDGREAVADVEYAAIDCG